jgi:excisionase family DNA binding protein
MTTDTLPDVLKVDEVARLLRLSRGAAYEAIRAGEIPSVRFGRTIRVPAAAVRRLLGQIEVTDP